MAKASEGVEGQAGVLLQNLVHLSDFSSKNVQAVLKQRYEADGNLMLYCKFIHF